MDASRTDVLILGAGLVGAVTALLLQKSGISVTVIEKANLRKSISAIDGRTTAVSFGSKGILEKAGVWGSLEPFTNPIQEIRTFESNSPFTLNFLAEDKKKAGIEGPLGYMIDNGKLREVLQQTLIDTPTITLLDNVEVAHFDRQESATTVQLSNGSFIKTKLIISCEGRAAPSRVPFNIQLKTWDYHHTALVGYIHHTLSHQGVAFEVFDPKGPLAFLPMLDRDGQHTSAIVWSSKENLKALSDTELLAQLNEKFPHLGECTSIHNRAYYPLKGQRVTSLIAQRYVLIGDAAHVMHPVAGQGVNLGWRDGMELSKTIGDAFAYGHDIGAAPVLESYRKKRRVDQAKLMITMDALVRLFDIDHPFIKMVRTYGIGIVDRIPFVKKFLMKQAIG